MLKSQDLLLYLNSLLSPDKFEDYCPNGLQLEGTSEIGKIAFAVSATLEAIEAASTYGAQALIVHHGLFWKFQGARPLVGPFGQRVKNLYKKEINLFAYHLPLDGHAEIGNAASLGHLIGLRKQMPFAPNKFGHMGVKGELDPITSNDLQKKLENVLGHKVIMSSDPEDAKTICSLGIITGGADNEWTLAKKDGLDAYITGEMSEHHWHDSKEANLTMFAGGHHATEKFGIQSLMKKMAHDYPHIPMAFFDSQNPA